MAIFNSFYHKYGWLFSGAKLFIEICMPKQRQSVQA